MEPFDLLDSESIDLDDIVDPNTPTEVYASEAWLQSVEESIGDNISGSASFDPDAYDDPRKWMTDELLLLFVRTHRDTPFGVTEFSGALEALQEQFMTLANVGLTDHAEREGRLEELFGDHPGETPDDVDDRLDGLGEI